MTLEEIKAEEKNLNVSHIEETVCEGESSRTIVCHFQIEEGMWNNIRNGTKAGMKAFLDWVDPED